MEPSDFYAIGATEYNYRALAWDAHSVQLDGLFPFAP